MFAKIKTKWKGAYFVCVAAAGRASMADKAADTQMPWFVFV